MGAYTYHAPSFWYADPPLDFVPFASFSKILNDRFATIDKLLDFDEQKASEEASKYEKDGLAIELLVRRWNKDNHTFIFFFREVTMTLEDVVELTLLPLFGENNPDFCESMSDMDKNEVAYLLIELGKVASSASPELFVWCRYYLQEEDLRLEKKRSAFVLTWLSLTFGCHPDGRVMNHFAAMAVKIAKGSSFALAPFFLGNLYHYLDLLVSDKIEASVYNWFGKKLTGKKAFQEVMDMEEEFCWRLYTKVRSRNVKFVRVLALPSLARGKCEEKEILATAADNFATCFVASGLPY
ncbi:hypothetical protein CCACVL1_07207 [Corchorus capsularis]|uniref:Aminotransferase-like plant mobile domain-containing protein n=1 Tax=Corchorus capsularis TaxID=210143 RepID=A0A1R3J8J6_COCAP|nr:hypothetical protein CCACVL1_07207 [Corchorus capsularis]